MAAALISFTRNMKEQSAHEPPQTFMGVLTSYKGEQAQRSQTKRTNQKGKTDMNQFRNSILASVTFFLCVCAVALALPTKSPHVEHDACFSASEWGPADDALRPCVDITRIWEDGSFCVKVADYSGGHVGRVCVGNPRD